MPGKTNDDHPEIETPPLPDDSLKIGQYVYTAMRNLSKSGYVFSRHEIDEMCSAEWTKKTFHTTKPFMKRYTPGLTDNKGTDGYVRFLAESFSFGDSRVLISKEWYERQRVFFVTWYNALKNE